MSSVFAIFNRCKCYTNCQFTNYEILKESTSKSTVFPALPETDNEWMTVN